MNHGYCKNCWWWDKCYKPSDKDQASAIIERFFKNPEPPLYGRCWMKIGDGELVTMTPETSYCRDYINRKKEERKNGTLERWLETIEEL